ncbi:MAG: formyltransferase [Steroidobacterales bacterium]
MTRAVAFAYSEVGYNCLEVLLAAGVDVALVITHRDDPAESRWYRSVAELGRRRGLKVSEFESLSATECLRALRSIGPDFLFSFYCRRMLAPALLACARQGALNMHGSLLPQYRGRAPVNWAIVNGESRTGASLHYMTERPDAGDLVDQEAVEIGVDDTALDVSVKVAGAARRVLERSLPGLVAGTAPRLPLDLARGSYFGGRSPADGEIDGSKPAWQIHNLIRAVAPPFPGAFAEVDGLRLELLGSQWRNEASQHPDQAPRLYASGGKLYLDCLDRHRITVTGARLDGVTLTAAEMTARLEALKLNPNPLNTGAVV